MNERDILKQLQALKVLLPDEEFCRRSLSSILGAHAIKAQSRWGVSRGIFEMFTHASLIGAVMLFIAVIVGALNYIPSQSPFALTGANVRGLIAEATDIDIAIDLPELAYDIPTISLPPAVKTPAVTAGESTPTVLSEASADEIDRLLQELSK